MGPYGEFHGLACAFRYWLPLTVAQSDSSLAPEHEGGIDLEIVSNVF